MCAKVAPRLGWSGVWVNVLSGSSVKSVVHVDVWHGHVSVQGEPIREGWKNGLRVDS